MSKLALAALLLIPLAALNASDFHVSPTGNDSNPGAKAKPFATLDAARTAARIASAAPPPSSGKSKVAPPLVITPNEFEGSDVERINRAIEAAATAGGRVVIPRKNIRGAARSEIWLLDSAILLRSNTTLELDNCRIKLSDRCRDNLMRNVKRDGITQNIHIRGIGNVVLEGADHPRATGDGGKILGKQTYGTDAGVAGESQKGDGRNFGIFLTAVEDFSLGNFTIKDSHCWAINLERCAKGTLRNLDFASSQFKVIDGVRRTILNQDGIDLRMGCHDILIENITGYTGDDLIALTGLSRAGRYAGAGDDIHHVTIKNIKGYCRGGNHIMRLLNNGGVRIHDILIDGLTDTAPVDARKADFAWGNSPGGDQDRG